MYTLVVVLVFAVISAVIVVVVGELNTHPV